MHLSKQGPIVRARRKRINGLAIATSRVVNQENKDSYWLSGSWCLFSPSLRLFLTIVKLFPVTLTGWHRSNMFLPVPYRGLLISKRGDLNL